MTELQDGTGLPQGTPILTPRGEVPVEDLRAGDVVISVSGAAAPFQQVLAVRCRVAETALVRIRAGALGEGMPLADLTLPPSHALLMDGLLIGCGALAGGGEGLPLLPVAPVPLHDIVLGSHDAVLAAGLAVETALPAPDAAACRPRAEPDGALRAMLAWRAEVMGWAPPAPPPDPPPDVGSLRERLAAAPLAPALPPEPPLPSAR